jgi:hypothetical protein
LPSGFPTKTMYTPLPHRGYMPRPSHSSRFGHPNNIWWVAPNIKLLIMYFSPIPCYLIPLRLKYSAQPPNLKHQAYVPPSTLALQKKLQFVPQREQCLYLRNAKQQMLYSGVHVHRKDPAEQINTEHRNNVAFNHLKPSGFFTYHQVEHSKILHGARFVLSVLYGSQNRQRSLMYTSLTGWFL